MKKLHQIRCVFCKKKVFVKRDRKGKVNFLNWTKKGGWVLHRSVCSFYLKQGRGGDTSLPKSLRDLGSTPSTSTKVKVKPNKGDSIKN